MIIENKCVNKQIISLKSYQKHCVDYHKDKLSHLSSTVQPHFEFCKGEKKNISKPYKTFHLLR